MQRQYYNDNTSFSNEVLHKISKNADFVLIGGWAVHAYVGAQRSLDIDIAVDYKSLDYFKTYEMQKYQNMDVNYVKIDGITVDLFIPEFTDKDLPFPVSAILSNYLKIDNIKVVKKEFLLILKLWGYFSNDETKLNKDIIDVVSLLFYGDVEMNEVKRLIERYKLEKRRTTDIMLEYLDKGSAFADFIIEGNEKYVALAEKSKKEIKLIFKY
jgi:hypothetical protein